MKKVPVYIQYDAMDCGPTCLRMISSFYNKEYSLDVLREYSSIENKGCVANTYAISILSNGMASICEMLYYNKNFYIGDIANAFNNKWDYPDPRCPKAPIHDTKKVMIL